MPLRGTRNDENRHDAAQRDAFEWTRREDPRSFPPFLRRPEPGDLPRFVPMCGSIFGARSLP